MKTAYIVSSLLVSLALVACGDKPAENATAAQKEVTAEVQGQKAEVKVEEAK